MRVMVFGTFDVLHDGHRFVLDSAKERGDLTVVVARDHHVMHIKEKKPRQSEEERRNAIVQEYSDCTVILGDEHDFLAPIRTVSPHLILLGYDQRLPPGITEEMIPCPIERLPAHHPDLYKSSLMNGPSAST